MKRDRQNPGRRSPEEKRVARVAMGPGAEFDLIRRLLGPGASLPSGVWVGPGDDALVLECGVVVSSDLTVEGVHFRKEWVSLRDVGYRGAAAALSDLAAMAAAPVGVLVSMAVGGGEPEEKALEVQDGVRQACEAAGVEVLGGDLSSSPGPLMLDVVVLGRTERPVLRAGGEAGDELWVTGWLGGSAGAVELWTRGMEPPEPLREAFRRPSPRLREAVWLAARVPLKALIDLSDGLGGDAGHLAAASGVGVILEESSLPIHPALSGSFPRVEERLALALHGGEDYELLLAVPPRVLEPWVAEFRAIFGIPLTRVGEVVAGEAVWRQGPGGELVRVGRGGFDHFGRGGGG